MTIQFKKFYIEKIRSHAKENKRGFMDKMRILILWDFVITTCIQNFNIIMRNK